METLFGEPKDDDEKDVAASMGESPLRMLTLRQLCFRMLNLLDVLAALGVDAIDRSASVLQFVSESEVLVLMVKVGAADKVGGEATVLSPSAARATSGTEAINVSSTVLKAKWSIAASATASKDQVCVALH